MYALDNKSGIEQMPEIPEVFSKNPLWFTEGRDGNSPSYPGAHWFNIVQAELLNVLKEAGIEPDKADLTQLAQAFRVMAGQVESIAALREFEPVRDRQVAFVKGYYAGSNKGGGYFIADFGDKTSADDAGVVIVTASGKRWKRIYKNIHTDDFGIKCDGSDETAVIQRMIRFAFDNNKKIIWQSGKTYTFNSLDLVGGGSVDWVSSSKEQVKLHSIKPSVNMTNYDADFAVRILAQYVGVTSVTTAVNMGYDTVTVEDASQFEVGNICELRSTRLIETDHRGQAREGQVMRIRKIVGNNLVFDSTINFQSLPWKYIGAVSQVNSATEFVLPSDINRSENEMRLRLSITSGQHAGEIRYITNWDNNSKTAQITGRQNGLPNLSAGDTFVLEWLVQATILRSPKVNINGAFYIYRDEELKAQAGDWGYRGLDVVMANNPILVGVVTEHFSDTGQRFRSCYKPIAIKCASYGANRAYKSQGNEADGTGYGFSEMQCFEARYIDCVAQRCRRGFDSGGTQQVSWGTKYINCEVYGAGLTYEGVSFYPMGSFLNLGMGTHGSGYNTEYINCRVYDMHSGYNHRGKASIVRDCAQYGYAQKCMTIYHACGLIVDGFIYDDRVTSLNKDIASAVNGLQQPNKRAVMFADIWCDQVRVDSPLIFKNIHAQSLRNYFLRLDRDGNCADIYLGNNSIIVSNEGNANANWRWVYRTSDVNVGRIVEIANNETIRTQNADGISADWGYYPSEIYPEGGYIKKANGAILTTIPNDSVLPIYVGSAGMLSLNIRDMRADRNYSAVGMMLEQLSSGGSDLSPLNAVNKKNVHILSEKPTGTTGIAGTIGVVLRPDNEHYLYVENRTGETAQVMLEVK